MLPEGTNLRLLFEDCQCEDRYLFEHASTRDALIDAIDAVGFQHLSNTGHDFVEGGYTSAFILAESHVIVHTWPEHDRIVIVEISVCDFRRPNRPRTLDLGDRITAIFLPKRTVREILPMAPRDWQPTCLEDCAL